MNVIAHLRSLFRRKRLEADMAEEMRAHLEEQTQRNVAAGMTEADARAASHRQFGGVAQIQERARDVFVLRWLDVLGRNLRFACQSLRKHPGFATTATMMLALGIGMSTACFSVTNFLLLRSMPFPDGERLMRVFATRAGAESLGHSPANYFDVKAAASSFSIMAAVTFQTSNITAPDQPPIARWGMSVTAEFLPMLGIQPLLGRSFSAEEHGHGKDTVVLLPHRIWTLMFAGDSEILGQPVRIGTKNVTVIGVLPPSFDESPLWGRVGFVFPSTLSASNNDRQNAYVEVVARLRTGVSRRQAQSELDTIAARLDADHPAENSGQGLRVTKLYASNMASASAKSSWMITGLASLVLVIACANLAGLQLARALARGHQYATRVALGARRRDVVIPAAVESLLLVGLGGVCGLFVTLWLNRVFSHYLSDPDAPVSIPVDVHVAWFALGACVITAVTFGLVPAWLNSRDSFLAGPNFNRRGNAPRAHHRLKHTLVVGQLALVGILISAAASLTLAIKGALDRDLGWRADNLTVATVEAPYARYHQDSRKRELLHALKDRLAQIPGIPRVFAADFLPVFNFWPQRIVAEDHAPQSIGQEPLALLNAVEAGFFSALSIPLKEGQLFPAHVRSDGPPVAVVNESLAMGFWPSESAIGKRIRLASNEAWLEIIGVVGDVGMALNFDHPESRLQVYRPWEQAPSHTPSLCFDTTLPPASLERSIRNAIAIVDPDIVVHSIDEIRRRMERMLAGNDLAIAVVSSFALIGLLIALIGLYGVVTHLTLQRTREIGIRMALGADHRAVIGLIVTQGGRLILCGIVIGLCGAYGVDQIYGSTWPELQPHGPQVRAAIGLLLLFAGLAACWLPARRAAKVDPVIALRAE